MAAAVGIGRFVYTPILPMMAETLALSKTQAGAIASANFLGYLAGALLAATPWIRGARRTWLLGALLASAATTAAMALNGDLTALMTLRFFGGAASAFVLVFASALVLDRLASAGRPSLSAVHFAGVGAGIAVSAVLVAVLSNAGGDWRVLWLVSGFVCAIAVPAVAALVPDSGLPAAASAPASKAPRQGLTALVVAYGLVGFGYVITATFIVAIVRGSGALRPVEPFVWLVVGLSAAPSVALWTWIAGRYGIAHAFAAGCLIEAVGVAASVLSSSLIAVIAAAALLGGTFMGLTALGLAAARRLASGDPRRALAVMTASFGFGQTVGPSFAGFASDWTGSFVLPSLAAASGLVVAAVLALRIDRPDM
jgi:predicted MFS family arabinose efflux permease